MTRTTIRSEDITAGQVKAADLASDAVNTSGLEDDIAILGFKVASNGSLAKYNLVDQTIDDFQDTSGVDASGSANEVRDGTGKYYSGVGTAEWVTGDRTSTVTATTDMGWDTGEGPFADVVNGVLTYTSGQSWFNASQTGYMRFDHGSGNSEVYSNSRWLYGWATANEGTYKWQGSNDAISWTDIGGNFTLTATPVADSVVRTDTHATMTSNTTAYRYYQCIYVSGNSTNSSGRRIQMQFYRSALNLDMTLVSTTTTAQAAPTKGDIVFTYTNGAGTTTLGTDVTAEYSADGGSTWTAMTLGSEGTTGGHNIATAHDVTLTSTSGTSMAYRIKTLNQSVSKTTRIQAVSLGWS